MTDRASLDAQQALDQQPVRDAAWEAFQQKLSVR